MDWAEHDEARAEIDGKWDARLWRRILAHARPYRRTALGLAAAGVSCAVLDVVFPMITARVIDAARELGPEAPLGRLLLVYASCMLAMTALVWLFICLAGAIATGFAHDVRRAAFERLQQLSFAFYDRHSVGWLMARLTSDAARLSDLLPWTLFDCVWGGSLVLGIAVMMLILHWQLALMVMVIIPPLAWISVFFQRKLIASQRAMRRCNSQLTSSFNEGITGVATSKTLVREEDNLDEFQQLSGAMYRYSVQNALQSVLYLPMVLTLGSIGVGIALWRGGVALTVGGDLTLGTLVAFMQYAALFYIPIQEMAARFTELQAAQASAERLQGLLDVQPDIADSPAVLAAGPAVDERIESIAFDDVSFSYKDGEPVLRRLSLEVAAGQTVALVGATGGGKSTIVSLLCRFYEPTSGSIRLNGTDYRQRSLAWLQSKLGIVLQRPHLFSGTIRENIRYGRLEATDAAVEEAARVVGAEAFIRSMAAGYDTEVGETGGKLSTGQRQLVSLARAVLADPEIFVMDEATSSVDTETERRIQSGIEAVLNNRTSFVIAHRLSTIRSADRILVVSEGAIVEDGDHAALMARGGAYAQLYRQQFARERAADLAATETA